jgi:hypothetical protein
MDVLCSIGQGVSAHPCSIRRVQTMLSRLNSTKSFVEWQREFRQEVEDASDEGELLRLKPST